MELQRGMRDKLDKYMRLTRDIEIEMDVTGGAVYKYCCFGVDSAGKLSDNRYMVFCNRKRSPGGEILYTSHGRGVKFTVNLSKIPDFIEKLVFSVSIDGDGTMRGISKHTAAIQQSGGEPVELRLGGMDFLSEKAIISIELYKRDGWCVTAVARGFNGGLSDLLRAYGGEESILQPPPPAPILPALPARVELRKGQKVNLSKGGSGALGEILINLNWSQPIRKARLFAPPPRAIDLDLGCLFELKNGRRGSVQALGNAFGSLDNPPYIELDGDDRSGASADGENLRINGKMIKEIKRILVYTFIYEGAANWAEAKGVVTVKCPGSPEIIVRMDEYGSNQPLCAIAMLENNNNETFSVEKLARFFAGQQFLDTAYEWGLRWVAGRK